MQQLPVPTWFFPFSISRFVTFPKGSPSAITSASFMSLGSLRTWTTRDGTPGLRTSPLNFFVSLPLAARKEKNKTKHWSRYNQGTEGFGSSWIMDWSSWQHKQTRQTSTSIKRIHPPWQPPTWVHDIGPVGYAGRKEFVRSPLQERENNGSLQCIHQWGLSMAGGEHSSHITEPLCDKAGSNLITKRGLSKHVWEKKNSTFLNREKNGPACQFWLPTTIVPFNSIKAFSIVYLKTVNSLPRCIPCPFFFFFS